VKWRKSLLALKGKRDREGKAIKHLRMTRMFSEEHLLGIEVDIDCPSQTFHDILPPLFPFHKHISTIDAFHFKASHKFRIQIQPHVVTT
jgi:hypothetical protein